MAVTIDLKRNRKEEDALQSSGRTVEKRTTDEANVFYSGIILAADDRLTMGGQEQSENAPTSQNHFDYWQFSDSSWSPEWRDLCSHARYARSLKEAWNEVRELNSELGKAVADVRTAHLTQG